jgi:hypothetical protein
MHIHYWFLIELKQNIDQPIDTVKQIYLNNKLKINILEDDLYIENNNQNDDLLHAINWDTDFDLSYDADTKIVKIHLYKNKDLYEKELIDVMYVMSLKIFDSNIKTIRYTSGSKMNTLISDDTLIDLYLVTN